MTGLRLDILGGFQLSAGDRASPEPSAKKAQALLAYLALQDGQTVSRDRLAGLLWPRSDHQRARHSLSQALSAIRRAVEDADADGLEIAPDWVRLAPGALDVDARRFAELASQSGRESLEKAVALYRGDFLDGFNINEPGFEAWLHGERQRLRERAVGALAGLLDMRAAAGQWDDAIATALKLLTVDPLDERAHRALMVAHARQGNAQAALRQFQELENLLKSELGAEPEAETRELRRDISHGRTWGRNGQTAVVAEESEGAAEVEGAVEDTSEESGALEPGDQPVPDTFRPAEPGVPPVAAVKNRQRIAAVAAMLALFVAAVGGTWWHVSRVVEVPAPLTDMKVPRPAPRLSIVVLPFTNRSGDSKQDYLADGITEDLISDLSRIRGAFVIARGTSFTYKGKTVNAKDVAKELNVRYVLEGSVRRSGNRVRVNAQLIDGETGSHIWSERFDRKFRDVFSLQNDVTGRIAGILKGELLEAESRALRHGPPDNLEAWDYALQGFVKAFENPRDVKGYSEAKALLDKSVEMDRNLVIGWIGLAHLHYIASTRGFSGVSRSEARKALLATAERAVSLDPKNADAQTELGLAYRINRQPEKSKVTCQKALELNPNYDEAFACTGAALIAMGKAAEAIPLLEKALQLNPRHNAFLRRMFIGMAHIFEGQPDEALGPIKKGLAEFRTHGTLNLSLISALALSGRKAEARKALAEYLGMKSSRHRHTIDGVASRMAYVSPDLNLMLEGLRRAGMPETQSKKAPRLSIVVLPFDNLSDDKNQGYFADGITEDLIADLSRIRDAFVIARGTSFTYKGKSVDPREVAKALNVRYVLEGSVRRSGDQVRVNVQLIDGQTGAHVWSERFDREMKNVFSLQNEVTGRIAAVLKLELLNAESRRLMAGPPKDLEAWDYALRAWATLITKPISEEGTFEAKALLQKALELDPNSALAWTAMARIHAHGTTSGWATTSKDESRRLMLEAARKAVALDPKSADAHRELGFAYRFHRRLKEAVSACRTAIDLNPNHHHAYQCLAMAKIARGQPAEALPLFEKSVRLNPREGRPARRNFFIGWAHLMAGNYDKAVELTRQGIAANPKMPAQYWVLASALGRLDRKDEARSALEEFIRVDKGRRDTIAKMRKQYNYTANFDHALEGLRRAGMPETDADKPPRLSIAVLPFISLSREPGKDYLADGITGDLIADLSRIRGAFVIGRGTSFTYKGKMADPKAVARELNVRYVMDGTVLRSDNRVRINAQLIDGATGRQIWADRFDRAFKDVFSLQDEVTGRIARHLKAELLRQESLRLRAGPPADLKAWDFALQGTAKLMFGRFNLDRYRDAKRLLDTALKLDPKLASAWTGMAAYYAVGARRGMPGVSRAEALKHSLKAAKLAISLDPTSADAHRLLGDAYRVSRRPEKALAECRTALDLNPNHADALLCVAAARMALGETGSIVPLVEKTMRLSPLRQPARRVLFIGLAQLFDGNHSQAAASFRKAMTLGPKAAHYHYFLAAVLAHKGNLDDARRSLARTRGLHGGRLDTIVKMRAAFGYLSPNFDKVVTGLRLAGMPEK